jgi:hypothetical protein
MSLLILDEDPLKVRLLMYSILHAQRHSLDVALYSTEMGVDPNVALGRSRCAAAKSWSSTTRVPYGGGQGWAYSEFAYDDWRILCEST